MDPDVLKIKLDSLKKLARRAYYGAGPDGGCCPQPAYVRTFCQAWERDFGPWFWSRGDTKGLKKKFQDFAEIALPYVDYDSPLHEMSLDPWCVNPLAAKTWLDRNDPTTLWAKVESPRGSVALLLEWVFNGGIEKAISRTCKKCGNLNTRPKSDFCTVECSEQWRKDHRK